MYPDRRFRSQLSMFRMRRQRYSGPSKGARRVINCRPARRICPVFTADVTPANLHCERREGAYDQPYSVRWVDQRTYPKKGAQGGHSSFAVDMLGGLRRGGRASVRIIATTTKGAYGDRLSVTVESAMLCMQDFVAFVGAMMMMHSRAKSRIRMAK